MATTSHSRWFLLRDRIKRFRQRLTRSRAAQRFACFLVSLYIRFVILTSKVDFICESTARPYITDGEKNAVLAFWHGRLLLVPPLKPKHRESSAMVSQHNDGELIALTLGHFNVGTVRGSSSEGGSRAAISALRLFAKGQHIAITPDGPRGPNRECKMGVVTLAKATKAPIIPMATSAKRHRSLKSWDKMQVALPFTHLVIWYASPVWVPKDAPETDMEAYRLAVDDALNAVTARADAHVGLTDNNATDKKEANAD